MFSREKIFTVYEKPEAADPADRVLLLREGFSFGAFVFTVFWLMYQRYWGVLLLYFSALASMMILADAYQLTAPMVLVAQLALNLMLAFHAYDLHGWWLKKRKDYRFAGVLVAESAMHAERRYYEFAA